MKIKSEQELKSKPLIFTRNHEAGSVWEWDQKTTWFRKPVPFASQTPSQGPRG